jgi:hypothetical protein
MTIYLRFFFFFFLNISATHLSTRWRARSCLQTTNSNNKPLLEDLNFEIQHSKAVVTNRIKLIIRNKQATIMIAQINQLSSKPLSVVLPISFLY